MDRQSKASSSKFVTLLVSFAAALTLLPGSAGASAVTYENTLPQGFLTAPFSKPIGNFIAGSAGQTFLDHYTFNLSSASAFNAIVTQFDLGSMFGITSLGVNLFTGGGAPVQSGFSLGAIGLVSAPSIVAGTYDLRVNGTLTGSAGGTYGGTMSAVAAPVPEPETYAMMLAGLGLMGFMARRRKQAQEYA